MINSEIQIQGKPFNHLQIYGVNHIVNDSNNQMLKYRPHLLIQAGEVGMYYGRTKFIAIPVSSSDNQTINVHNEFTVEVKIDKVNERLLLYNFVTRSEDEIGLWYNNRKEKKPIYISYEQKLDVLEKMEEYNMESLSYENEALGRKTMYQQLKESNESLERSNKELRFSYSKLENSHYKLEKEYEQVKESNDKLVKKFEEFEKLLKEKLN